MSQESVDVVRDALDAYSRRDIEAARQLHHPDMELDWSASRSALARVYRGIDDAERSGRSTTRRSRRRRSSRIASST